TKVHVALPGVKGVTDTSIRVGMIISKTNPTGGKYKQFGDGVRAYLDMINSQGGIYGRKIDVVADVDDQLGNNAAATTSMLADQNVFALFEAPFVMTGIDALAKARVPTFMWNTNAEFASTAKSDHSNVFANSPAIDYRPSGLLVAYLAEKEHFTDVGIVAY